MKNTSEQGVLVTSTARAGRPPHRRDSLVAELRRRIIDGELKPGSRLPGRHEMAQQFNSALVTVHEAVQCLVRDGFVETQGTRGTFVAEHPPHLHRYAIIFHNHPQDGWSRFYEAIRVAAETMERDDPRRRFSLCYEINGHADVEDYQTLLTELRSQRLAGLIFTSPPYSLVDTPLLADDGVPRVAVAHNEAIPHDPRFLYDRLPLCFPDSEHFLLRALDLAAASGPSPRRVAIMTPSFGYQWQEWWERTAQATSARGLSFERRHAQATIYTSTGCIHQCIYGLLGDAPERRPNVLIITDDNYVEEATKAIVEMGIRVPQDLTVIAHCNYPVPPVAAVPVIRLGFDARALLNDCTDALDRQRRGEVPSPVRRLPALLESEVVPDTHGSISTVAPRHLRRL